VASSCGIEPAVRLSTQPSGADYGSNGCEVCCRLLNLWLTGEWKCPRCHEPSAEVADKLRLSYVLGK
jgi:hypothetical protein